MKRILFVSFLFFALFGLLFPAGELYKIGKYRILRVSGSPYEIGLSYGKIMKKYFEKEKKEISELHSLAMRRYFFLFRPIASKIFNGKIKKKAKMVPPEYLKELKGLSLSSNIELKDLMFLNFLYDFSHPSCSSFIVKKRRSLIFGRNLDYMIPNIDLGDKTLIILFEPEKGYKYIGFTFLGLNTFLTGINEKGIAIELNEIPTKGKGDKGFPPLYLMKMIMQYASNMKEVENLIVKHKIHIGVSFTVVSEREKKGAVFEVAYNKVKKRELKDDFLVSTNHFLTDLKDKLPLPYRSSVKRYIRIKELIEKRMPAEFILKDQLDISNNKISVLSGSVNNDYTVHSILFDGNRVIFSAGSNYAPDREKILFLTKDFFNGKIRGKVFSKERISYQEQKFTLFLLSSGKTDSLKEKLKFLEDIYFSEKFIDYYIVKAELLRRMKKYDKALETIKEAENKEMLNDTLLQIKIEILKKKKKKKELSTALESLKKLRGSEEWFDFKKIKEGWDPYRKYIW